jgi:hypothetical protein
MTLTRNALPTKSFKPYAAALAAGVVLVLAVLGSLGMYFLHRNSADYSQVFGATDNPDRVDVSVWVSHVDTVSQTMSVEVVDIEPMGALADGTGDFRSDAVLTTSSLGDPIALKKGETGSDTERRFAVTGTVTDYPFDRYHSSMTFNVTDISGTVLPVAVTIWSGDPFFSNAMSDPPQAVDDDSDGVGVDVTATRSTPTMVFALFVMVLMLGLAAAAATAGYYVLRWRRGLSFPACSIMAAILFALIPLRNAVPGNPPIGSVIDFGSFFIAEAIISISLIASVIIGYRVEVATELAQG